MAVSGQPFGVAGQSRPLLEALDEVSEAVESGAGLPSVTRAAGRALGASVIVLDSSSSVLAVACESSEDERAVMAGESGTETVDLLLAEAVVGQLRFRVRGESPPAALLRLVANLIALELDRAKAPERASEEAVGDFLGDLLARRITDRENIAARSAELGCDLAGGATALVVRARPHTRGGRLACPRADARGARSARGRAHVAGGARGVELGRGPNEHTGVRGERELVILAPGPAGNAGRRVAGRSSASSRPICRLCRDRGALAAHHRPGGPAPRRRRGAVGGQRCGGERPPRALLRGDGRLPAPPPGDERGPGRAAGLFDETVAPLVAYDDQYETDSSARWRPSSTPTETSRAPLRSSSPTDTPSATAWSA